MSSQKNHLLCVKKVFLSSYVFQYEMNYYKRQKRTYQTTKVLILIRSK